jgi:hypothetical protein
MICFPFSFPLWNLLQYDLEKYWDYMSKKTSNTKLTNDKKIKIRNLYVQGMSDEQGNRTTYTLDQLYKEHNVAKSTLYRVAQKENWKLERDKFQEKYLADLDAQRTKDLTEESKKFDINSLNLAKALMATVGQNIRSNTENINNGNKHFQPSQLHALANAALASQKLAKLALGETTENVNLNANLQDEAFREAMDLLDSIADGRRESDDKAVH